MIAPTNSLHDRYRGKRVFLTGATGFLGQVVLEKMVRALPDVAGIEVLVRSRGRQSSSERLEELLASPLFDRARSEHGDFQEWCRERVTPLDGSLTEPRFGVDRTKWGEIAERTDIVIHVGAVASFYEPVDRVLRANTQGSLTALDLARRAGDVPLTHVSTCYVCGKVEGEHLEEPLPWGHTPSASSAQLPMALDPEAEVEQLLTLSRELRTSVEEGAYDEVATRRFPAEVLGHDRLRVIREQYADRRLSRLGIRVATRLGWPDPYPMSKAFAEQLLVRKRGGVPLAIVRPSILASTLREPFPGWLQGLRMADPLIAAMGRGVLGSFPGDPKSILDVLPCDLAANAVLIALPERGSDGVSVYQTSSSTSNPLPLGDFNRLWRAGLVQHPFTDRQGRRISPSRVRLTTPEGVRRRGTAARRWYTLWAALLGRIGLGRRARSMRARLRGLRTALLLGRAYEPYTMRHFRFVAERMHARWADLAPEDRDGFPIDANDVSWTRYLTEVHVPAVREEAGGAPAHAKRRMTWNRSTRTSDEPEPVST